VAIRERVAAPPPSAVGAQLGRFAAIGTAAFAVDAGTLQLLLPVAGLHAGRVLSWTTAATFTWYLNRRLTFSGAEAAPRTRQWLQYLAANAVGGLANYGTYAALVELLDTVRQHPTLGVAAGSVVGLALNFWLSRRLMVRRNHGAGTHAKGP
jgi:putative flippase GtrA